MAVKEITSIVWNMFENSGSLGYYLLFRKLDKDAWKSPQERQREEIERLTR